MRRLLAATLVAAAATLLAPTVRAAGYTFTAIDFPTANSTAAYGINNLGQIVGSYVDASLGLQHNHGFVYDGTTFTTIDSTIGPDTILRGINDQGVMVGQAGSIAGSMGGMIDDHGVFTSVPVESVNGIDHVGVFVGFTGHFPAIPHAVFGFNPTGPLYTLDYPGMPGSWLSGVNNLGAVVGAYERPDGLIAGYISIAGQFGTTDPGIQITCINDQLTFGGYYSIDVLFNHGFVYTNGIETPIDFPGASTTIVYGINNAGTVVGTYNNWHGFMATPQ